MGGTPGRRFLRLFWRETKQRPELEISDETRSGRGKAGPREAREELAKEPREGQFAKEPREGQLAKGDAERQSTIEERGERSALSGLSRECQRQQKRPVGMR